MSGSGRGSGFHTAVVSFAVLASRIAGFIRERLFAHYLGNGVAAGAFRAALRIPNLLQNLFGEGALSASFIPVYARLIAEGREADARKLAHAVGTLMLLLLSVLAVLTMAERFVGNEGDAFTSQGASVPGSAYEAATARAGGTGPVRPVRSEHPERVH